jgi:hypothetical protein
MIKPGEQERKKKIFFFLYDPTGLSRSIKDEKLWENGKELIRHEG